MCFIKSWDLSVLCEYSSFVLLRGVVQNFDYILLFCVFTTKYFSSNSKDSLKKVPNQCMFLEGAYVHEKSTRNLQQCKPSRGIFEVAEGVSMLDHIYSSCKTTHCLRSIEFTLRMDLLLLGIFVVFQIRSNMFQRPRSVFCWTIVDVLLR